MKTYRAQYGQHPCPGTFEMAAIILSEAALGFLGLFPSERPLPGEISHASRNVTDKQLAAVRESRGIVGLIFHVGLPRPDGRRDTNTPLSVLVDHVDHLVGKLGIDGVGFGSDFDGAPMPIDLKDAVDLPKLMRALADRGYDDAALQKIAHGNWVRVLHETWGG